VRTYDEAFAAARDGRPFGYEDELHAWQAAWCDRCAHDRTIDVDGGCPLVMVALMGRTPSEWWQQPPQPPGPEFDYARTFTCVEFRPDDEAPAEPTPLPDPPGMDALVEREQWTGSRMLAPLPEREAVAS
jgi:hypothetical protein